MLLVTVSVVTGYWPAALWKVVLIILPISLISGGLGIITGLVIQKTIPCFMIALITSFVSWIIGSAFGLAAGFGRGYAITSLFAPNSCAVELLFLEYFGTPVGDSLVSIAALVLMSMGVIFFSILVYRQRVTKQE